LRALKAVVRRKMAKVSAFPGAVSMRFELHRTTGYR
jgi:hypothetical protein